MSARLILINDIIIIITGDYHVTCVQLSKPDVATLSYRRSHYWWQKKVSVLCFCENLSSFGPFGPSFAQVKACAILAIVNFVANNQIMH